MTLIINIYSLFKLYFDIVLNILLDSFCFIIFFYDYIISHKIYCNVISFTKLFIPYLRIAKRNVSTRDEAPCYNDNINPWAITGLTDGDGTFIISIRKSSEHRTGWEVQLIFRISLHHRDLHLLHQVRSFFGNAGSINKGAKGLMVYRVSSLKDLEIIVDHFTRYPLVTQKKADFLLLKRAFEIKNLGDSNTVKGLQEIVNLRASSNNGLTEELKEAFPKTIPAIRLIISGEDQKIPDPNWVSGFVSVEFSKKWRRSFGINHKRSYSTDIRQPKSETPKNLVLWGTNLTSTTGERFTRSQLSLVKLPLHIKSIMVGLILSDAWIVFKGKRSKNALIGFKQSISNFAYLWYVFNLLSHYCSSYPYLVTDVRKGKIHYALVFETRSMPCITELRSLFYPELSKVKVIPLNIYDMLTPAALAHLIMGDGGFKSKGIYLCTDCYTIQNVVRLMNVLIIRYELKCTLHKSSKNYRIYISRKSVGKVVELIKPYLIPSMYYKVGLK